MAQPNWCLVDYVLTLSLPVYKSLLILMLVLQALYIALHDMCA